MVLDKTGTLTEGEYKMEVVRFGEKEFRLEQSKLLSSLVKPKKQRVSQLAQGG